MDYKLIDTGYGRRLEKFGKFVLDRPDPQIVWDKILPKHEWEKADAYFQRTEKDKGIWKTKYNFPDSWILTHKDISFKLKLSPFKHTGVFPEQSWEWELLYDLINNEKQEINVLNLFAYTGISTLFALKAGAKVTHVDASRSAISWFKENQSLSGLTEKPCRYILDDVRKFILREIKRKAKYDVIIMDPPVYGHGPKGEVWSFNKDFPIFLEKTVDLLSERPLLFLINAYAISSSAVTLANILQDKMRNFHGDIKYGELTLKEESGSRTLSTGLWSTWTKN